MTAHQWSTNTERNDGTPEGFTAIISLMAIGILSFTERSVKSVTSVTSVTLWFDLT